MWFRVTTSIRNLFETAQRLKESGSFRGFGGFGVLKEDGRETGGTCRRPLPHSRPLESFRQAPKPQNLETAPTKPCVRQGCEVLKTSRAARNPCGLAAGLALRRGVKAAYPDLSVNRLSHTEKGRRADSQTSSFTSEVP